MIHYLNRMSNTFLLLASLGFVIIGFSIAINTQNADISLIILILVSAYQITVAAMNFFKKMALKSWGCIKGSLIVMTVAEAAIAISLYFRRSSIINAAGQYYSKIPSEQVAFSNSIRHDVEIAIYCGLALAAIQIVSTGAVIYSHLDARKPKSMMAKKLMVETTEQAMKVIPEEKV